MPQRLLALLAPIMLAATAAAEEPTITSRLELRESPTSYTIKVTTDEPGSLQARLQGNRLHLTSGAEPGAPRLMNTLVLPAAATAGNPVVEPGDGIVTIVVAKGAANPADPFAGFFDNNAFPSTSDDALDAVRNSMLSRFSDLWNEVDQLMEPGQRDLLNDIITRAMPGQPPPTAPSPTDFAIADEGGNYVLTATMPKEQAKNVRVNVDNGRFVSISSEAGVDAAGAFQHSSFTRAMTLPGEVDAAGMRIDYSDGALRITLPKAP